MASAEYMRQRRAEGGDGLRRHENEQRQARRETEEGREVRRGEYRRRYAKEHGTAVSGDGSFVGVDGEGGRGADGRHYYYLLRAGERVLETGSALGWQDCFEFLCSLDPRNVYVSFFFDYDVTKMCESMPEYKIRRLLNRQERFNPNGTYNTPLPLDIGSYEIDYIPHKFFKIRKATPAGQKNRPWIEISDVARFFQASFVRVLLDWNVGTPEEIEAIGRGKETRAEFGQITDDIRRYNELECDLLERLMNKFRATCHAIGHLPRKWQGPGDLAASLLQYHRIPKKNQLVIWDQKDFLKFADQSYYGGRFETSAVGEIPGPVYAADINSAYPYSLLKVPCLVHGTWARTFGKPTSSLYIAQGSAQMRDSACFYGLPFRGRNGGVSFPGDIGVGTYWSFEILSARHQDFEIQDSWSYHQQCDCTPFDWVPDLYWRRLQLKKDTQGKVLKLALNSLYGKMAQRIGSAPYNNYVHGSFITAYCRTMLQNFIHSLPSCEEGRCGDNVWMLATDGIYTSELPKDFESNDKLGGWSLNAYPEGIFIVQPGLYFDNAGRTLRDRLTKTRGIPVNLALEHEEELRIAFQDLWQSQDPTNISVTIPMTNFIGLRLAMHRRQSNLAGQWKSEERHITFDWRSKRQLDTAQATGYLRTFPQSGSLLDISRPYSKELARELDERRQLIIDWSDGPDWSAVLASPDEVF